MVEQFGLPTLIAAFALGGAAGIGLWSTPKPVAQFWSSLAIWCVQLLIAMAAAFYIVFLGISTPHCSPDCEWELLHLNSRSFMWAAAAIQAASLVVIVALRRHRRVRLVPLTAIALLLALFAISHAVAYKAMLFF